jgi:tetratricopeptide (TPR) repeat protein
MGDIVEYKKESNKKHKGSLPDHSISGKEQDKPELKNEPEAWSEADIYYHRQLLQKLMDENEIAHAKIIAKHLTEFHPDDGFAWYVLGVSCLGLSDAEYAEKCLIKSMEISGTTDAWDCFHMAGARLLMGDLKNALKWCLKAVKRRPEIPIFHWRLMEIHTVRGDLEAAIAAGIDALPVMNETSSEIRTRRTLADLYLSVSAFKESEEQLFSAMEKVNVDPGLWYALGQCMSRQKKWEEALTAFQKANEFNPHDADIQYNIGDVFISLGQPDKAIPPLLQAIRLRNDFSLAHYDLGLAYFQLKKYPEAAEASRAALRDDPQMAFQWLNVGMGATENLGIALINQGKLEEAEACFRRNLKLLAPTYFNLGLTLFRTKRYPEALENFQRALELEPDDPEYHNLLGQTYDELGQPEEAEQSLRHAIELNKHYAMGYYDLGVILAKRDGRSKEAMKAFEQALKNDPDMMWAYYSIACLYALAQKEDQALEYLEKAFQKGLRDFAHIKKDHDWDGLRTNPKFIGFLKHYREIRKID